MLSGIEQRRTFLERAILDEAEKREEDENEEEGPLFHFSSSSEAIQLNTTTPVSWVLDVFARGSFGTNVNFFAANL